MHPLTCMTKNYVWLTSLWTADLEERWDVTFFLSVCVAFLLFVSSRENSRVYFHDVCLRGNNVLFNCNAFFRSIARNLRTPELIVTIFTVDNEGKYVSFKKSSILSHRMMIFAHYNQKKKFLQVIYTICYIYTMKDDLRGGCIDITTKYIQLIWVYIIKRGD